MGECRNHPAALAPAGLPGHVIRPVLSINGPDPEYAVKVAHLEEGQEQARKGEIILLYEDEIDLSLLPGVIRCWTKRGHQRKIPTPGQNVKHYGLGAVNFMTGQLTYRIGIRTLVRARII